MKKFLLFAFVSTSIFLSACGGGGSSGSTGGQTDLTLTIPFHTAMANIVNKGISGDFTASGWVINTGVKIPLTMDGVYSRSAASGASLNTPAGLQSLLKQTLTIKGSVVMGGAAYPLSGTSDYYFSAANYAQIALVDLSKNYFFTPYSNPAFVQAGAAGSLGSASDQPLTQTITQSYSIAPDTSSSLLATVNWSTKTSVGVLIEEFSTVYRVDNLGNAKFVAINNKGYDQGKQVMNLDMVFK